MSKIVVIGAGLVGLVNGRQRLLLGVMAGLLLLVLPSASCASAAAGVIWSGGIEGGNLREWTQGNGGGLELTGSGTVSASTDVAHSGRFSAKMTISGADGSNGNQAARLFRWDEPRSTPQAYYSAWFYFPQSYSGMNWWNVFQFKSKLSERVDDPLWILNVGNRRDGSMYFYLYDWFNQRVYEQSVANIPVGQWVQVEAFYQQATNNTGRVTFWENGEQILDVTGVVTKRPGDETHWSLDNYTDTISPSTATIYVDDAAISTSRLGPGSDAPPPPSPNPPRFDLGFKTLANLLGGTAGQPVENEHFNPANGDSLQHTTTGLMVWRKSDNWTAFTNGGMTWVNGPYGLQERPNDKRFSWESQ